MPMTRLTPIQILFHSSTNEGRLRFHNSIFIPNWFICALMHLGLPTYCEAMTGNIVAAQPHPHPLPHIF